MFAFEDDVMMTSTGKTIYVTLAHFQTQHSQHKTFHRAATTAAKRKPTKKTNTNISPIMLYNYDELVTKLQISRVKAYSNNNNDADDYQEEYLQQALDTFQELLRIVQ
jgi:hypothetical protein